MLSWFSKLLSSFSKLLSWFSKLLSMLSKLLSWFSKLLSRLAKIAKINRSLKLKERISSIIIKVKKRWIISLLIIRILNLIPDRSFWSDGSSTVTLKYYLVICNKDCSTIHLPIVIRTVLFYNYYHQIYDRYPSS